VMTELQGWEWNIGLMPYGDLWRTRRRLIHQSFHSRAFEAHYPNQVAHTKKFLISLYNKPKPFRKHIENLTAGIAMSIAYAHEITDDDTFASTAEEAARMFSESGFPGAVAVNSIPILRYLPEWFPGAGFKAYARKCRELTKKMRYDPLNMVKQKMADGTAPPSVTRALLESWVKNTADEEAVADVAGIIYAAGSDTLLSMIASVISALVQYPEVQRRAQEEIDAVIGRERLPIHEDKDLMPYTEAICREVLRWQPVTPLGILRSNIVDDVYDGWLIPKGTIVLWNVWAIGHDPDNFPDPYVFKPERWLDADGCLIDKEFGAIFGYGRRSCVGIHMAKSTLWLTTASILAVMELHKSKDEHGNELDIPSGTHGSVLVHPIHFDCDIQPRDGKAVELLESLKSDD